MDLKGVISLSGMQHPSRWAGEPTAVLPVYNPDADPLYGNFVPEALAQAAYPTGGDPAIANFAMRLIVGMADTRVSSGVQELVSRVHTARPMGASHLFNLMLRGIQKQALRDFPDQYPALIDSRLIDPTSFWDELILRIVGGRDLGRWEELYVDMSTRRPVTNEARRRIGPALVEQLLGPPAVAIEGGCSQNLIGKAMILGLPIGQVAVLHRQPGRDLRRSPQLSRLVPEVVDAVEGVLRIGIDLQGASLDDQQWFRASPYPGELLDLKKVAEREMLASVQLPHDQLQFYQLDFTDPDEVDAFLDTLRFVEWQYGLAENGERYVHLITSAYEDPEMLEAAKKVAGPTGVVAVQDHVVIDESDNTKLRFLPHWPEWEYKLVVLQMKYAERGWQHVMTGRTSRLHEIVLGEGLLVVDGKERTVVDLLFRAVRRLRGQA